MSTLLLRFAAPFQAWGVDSKFNRRATEREPTKSGVIGFLAAALGRRREENVDDLVMLKFGVRVDQPGQFLADYHIARTETAQKHGVSLQEKNAGTFQTIRHYLADAVFLIGLEGSVALLQTIEAAVRSPAFPLYLGRRSCPPVGRVSLGIRERSLREALMEEPWQASPWYRKRMPPNVKMTLVCDAQHSSPLRRRDLPISFSQTHRQYAFRSVDDRVNGVLIENPDGRNADVSTKHDPFEELGG